MNIRTPAGFGRLNVRERTVASAVLSILTALESIEPYMLAGKRARIMEDIEAEVIKLAKFFY